MHASAYGSLSASADWGSQATLAGFRSDLRLRRGINLGKLLHQAFDGKTRFVWRTRDYGNRAGAGEEPLIRIRRRLEFSDVEYLPNVIWSGDSKQKRQTVAWALKVRDPDAVSTARQMRSGHSDIRWVLAIVVDDGIVVYKQPGPIVGQQRECITAGLGNPEAA